MALNADVGNGATLTLSEETTSYAVVSITPGSRTIESLEVSTLATTGDKEYIPTELKETPEGTAEILFYAHQTPPVVGDTHTITVSFPVGPAQTTTNKATLAGTGFITSFEFPELVNDQVMRATIGWKLDGDTGPTFTAGA